MFQLAALRRARWAVAAIFLTNGTIIGTWAAHIPVVKERLDVDHATLGFALLAMAIGALLAMPVTGALISRFGSALVTRVALAIMLLAFILPLLAPSVGLLFPALVLFGAANGIMDIAMNAHGVLVERELKRPIMSSLHGMWSLGGLLGAGLAAALLPVVPAFSEALVAIAVAAVAGVTGVSFMLPTDADGGAKSGPAFALPTRAAIGLGILCFLAMVTEGAVTDWSALHLTGKMAATPGVAATAFAAFSASMAAGRFLGDWIRAHVGAVAVVRGSALLAAAGLFAAVLAPTPLLAVIGFCVSGLGVANLVPVFFGAAAKLPGKDSGAGIAAIGTLGYAGFLVGPPLIGFVASATTLTFALGLVVLACLAVAAAARIVDAPGRDGG